jgi:hypothetical protein
MFFINFGVKGIPVKVLDAKTRIELYDKCLMFEDVENQGKFSMN